MAISSSGLNALADGIILNSATSFNNIAVGDGATGFSAVQIALVSEDIRKATTNTNTTTTGGVTKAITLLTTDIAGTNLSEVGAVSNPTSGGTLLNRKVFSPTLHAGTSQTRINILFTWKR